MEPGASPRWAVAIALTVVVGCSSSSPTSPGSVPQSLGNVAAPTPKAEALAEKLTLKGRVLDARTGEALAKAVVVAYRASDASSDSGAATTPPASTDSATASAAATADAAPAKEAEARPRPKGSLPPPVKTTADDKGDFEIKDLPPGTYAVTAFQKGYVAVSFVGGRPASGRLDIALPPQGDPAGGYEVNGKVFLLSRKPASGVMVAAALPPGLFAASPAISDSGGGFTLADLPAGKLLMAAWTLGDAGELRTWGVQREVKVAEGKEKKSSSPQITLRAVSKSIVLSGKVAAPSKAIRPRQVQVLLATEDGPEIALLTRTPDRDGFYRFGLPAPEDGATYHLVASGVDPAGNAVYAHTHKIAGPSHALDLQLPDLPATPSLFTEPQPEWTWTSEPDVSVYRVRLETTGDDGKTLWEGWTTGTSIALPQIGALALKHGESYRFTVSAIRAQGAFELAEIGVVPWAAAASLAPREFIAGRPFKNEPPAPRGQAAEGAAPGPRAAAPAEPPAVPGAAGAYGPAPARPPGTTTILPSPPSQPPRDPRTLRPGATPPGGPAGGPAKAPAPPAIPQPKPAPTRTPIVS